MLLTRVRIDFSESEKLRFSLLTIMPSNADCRTLKLAGFIPSEWTVTVADRSLSPVWEKTLKITLDLAVLTRSHSGAEDSAEIPPPHGGDYCGAESTVVVKILICNALDNYRVLSDMVIASDAHQ